MANDPSAELPLTPLRGAPLPLSAWLTIFHLVVVAVDPFTNESAWILPTARRILHGYGDADCRVGWLITSTPEEAEAFLGPLSREFLTFVDPDRTVVKGLGLERLPALVHVLPNATLGGVAEGWDPLRWREVTEELSTMLGWTRPAIPDASDPRPYDGSPAVA